MRQFMVLILISILLLVSPVAQNMKKAEKKVAVPLQEAWIDPATKLMWAGKDNQVDVKSYQAKRYCRFLRLGGHSDWRLATIQELEGIYSEEAQAPGLNIQYAERIHKHNVRPQVYHVKGNLFLTGVTWSATPVLNENARPSGWTWVMDFRNGRMEKSVDGFFGEVSRRALCVRQSD